MQMEGGGWGGPWMGTVFGHHLKRDNKKRKQESVKHGNNTLMNNEVVPADACLGFCTNCITQDGGSQPKLS